MQNIQDQITNHFCGETGTPETVGAIPQELQTHPDKLQGPVHTARSSAGLRSADRHAQTLGKPAVQSLGQDARDHQIYSCEYITLQTPASHCLMIWPVWNTLAQNMQFPDYPERNRFNAQVLASEGFTTLAVQLRSGNCRFRSEEDTPEDQTAAGLSGRRYPSTTPKKWHIYTHKDTFTERLFSYFSNGMAGDADHLICKSVNQRCLWQWIPFSHIMFKTSITWLCWASQ